MRFNIVILGLDPRIQTINPPLDSSFRWNDVVGMLDSGPRIRYGTSFAGMTVDGLEWQRILLNTLGEGS